MGRDLESNTSIGSTASANSAKSVDSPMSRNRGKIWEKRLDLGNSEAVSNPGRPTTSGNYCRPERAVSFPGGRMLLHIVIRIRPRLRPTEPNLALPKHRKELHSLELLAALRSDCPRQCCY